ncbi:thiamine pyrophosphate-dependent dehydrogenase E1 component subunit alpha [Nocardioides humi]|uniref:2-oxoisovalerate dehydrogenase subunit alpha n=1 Tax=Nocardioides humi TaxID=449461 RepID=A0ABN2AGG9_9ACTN|nr:thiamine pyrophosphate-dependent dehydrogenase E1 component subunit alpha [Nocardioides humi]
MSLETSPGTARDVALSGYELMVTARQIELECVRLSGHWYAAIGEEAVLAGAYGLSSQHGDVLFPHYRGAMVVHYLRGRSLEDLFLSVLARKGSSSQGRHIAPLDGWLQGDVMPWTSYMLGPNIPFGSGAALALSRSTTDRVAIVGLGDGTAGTGDFHEGLNMASALNLPVVFVCHNNQFSISTRPQEVLATESIASWARGYQMPSVTVDGNDLKQVQAAVGEAVRRARRREGPSFVECLTFRRTGHFASDHAPYRDSAELAMWEKRDPIESWERELVNQWNMSRSDLKEIRTRLEEVVKQAAATAETAPHADEEDLSLEGVYDR